MKLRSRIVLTVIVLSLFINVIFLYIFISDKKSDGFIRLNNKIKNNSILLNHVNSSPLYEINIPQLKTNLESFYNDLDIIQISLKEFNGNINLKFGKLNKNKSNFIKNETIISYNNEKLGVITTYYTTGNIQKELFKAFTQIIISFIFLALIITIALYFLLNKIIKPIIDLTELSSEIASGNLDKDIKTSRKDEIGILAVSFMKMRDSIKETIQSLEKENEERKIAENNLIKAKNIADELGKSKTNFLANISHELRTPMNSILAYSSMGVKKIDAIDKEKTIKYFNNINTSGTRLLHLLEDLINIAKLESGKNKYTIKLNNLTESINQSISEINLTAKERKIDIKFEKFDTPIELYFDNERLMQVISNILSNAVKFSPDNTSIFINLKTTDEYVMISIKDQGVGIANEDLRKIFSSFVQGKRTTDNSTKGAGLGLAISQKIIENHNGKIWAFNNKNEVGATFRIQIPRNLEQS